MDAFLLFRLLGLLASALLLRLLQLLAAHPADWEAFLIYFRAIRGLLHFFNKHYALLTDPLLFVATLLH